MLCIKLSKSEFQKDFPPGGQTATPGDFLKEARKYYYPNEINTDEIRWLHIDPRTVAVEILPPPGCRAGAHPCAPRLNPQRGIIRNPLLSRSRPAAPHHRQDHPSGHRHAHSRAHHHQVLSTTSLNNGVHQQFTPPLPLHYPMAKRCKGTR